MRKTLIALAVAATATSATAMDLPVPGLALNTDVVATHKVDADTTTLTAAPELAYTPEGTTLELTAGTTFNLWNRADGVTLSDEFDTLPTIDFGATYVVPTMDNVELGLGTSYDFEAESRGEVTMTATFSF